MKHQPPVPKIKIAEITPCLADPEKIRFIAHIDQDVSSLFPYLNAVLKGAIYNHAGRTLTLRMEGRLISLHPRLVAAGKIIDEQDAQAVIEWIKEKIGYCRANKDSLEPTTERRQRLTALDIFKLLPGTNCRKCGELTCLAFSVELAEERVTVMKCQDIFFAHCAEKRKELFRLLKASGYDAPSVFARD
jgi:ArsR family metal-binding transcriptional regulator